MRFDCNKKPSGLGWVEPFWAPFREVKREALGPGHLARVVHRIDAKKFDPVSWNYAKSAKSFKFKWINSLQRGICSQAMRRMRSFPITIVNH